MSGETGWPASEHLIAVDLGAAPDRPLSRDAEHERAVAVYDLLQENRFSLPGHAGPYRLRLNLADRQLFFEVGNEFGEPLKTVGLALSPFRRVLRDYLRIVESYHEAIRSAAAHRIEPIDMARRGVHDEGAALLRERLAGKIEVDWQTARRLFTLINVLHWQGRQGQAFSQSPP